MPTKLFQRTVSYKPVTIEDGDLLTIQQAVDLSGYPMYELQHMMDRDQLPVLVMDTISMRPRYTLRSAVEALPRYQPKRRQKEGEIPLRNTSGAKRVKLKAERSQE
jgi:hypothetical protein